MDPEISHTSSTCPCPSQGLTSDFCVCFLSPKKNGPWGGPYIPKVLTGEKSDMKKKTTGDVFVMVHSRHEKKIRSEEEGEAIRGPERTRETNKEDKDKTRPAEDNTIFLYLTTPLRVHCTAACCCRWVSRIIPYLWDGPGLMCCCPPFRFFLFCCCCYRLGLCSADGSLLLRGRICA